jgi:hypothetical protein
MPHHRIVMWQFATLPDCNVVAKSPRHQKLVTWQFATMLDNYDMAILFAQWPGAWRAHILK